MEQLWKQEDGIHNTRDIMILRLGIRNQKLNILYAIQSLTFQGVVNEILMMLSDFMIFCLSNTNSTSMAETCALAKVAVKVSI